MKPGVRLQPANTTKIRLPQSSSRLQKPLAHLRLLSAVRPRPFGAAFEGRLFSPGAMVGRDELGARPVVIECVGAVGSPKHGRRREVLWILWRFDWLSEAWIEIARAQAVGPEWAVDALRPSVRLTDVKAECSRLTDQIVADIDRAIEGIPAEVQARVFASVYDKIAGRIVGAP